MLNEVIFLDICRNEGLFSDDKTDTGNADLPDGTPGMTYVGVARVHHPTWAGWARIDEARANDEDLNGDDLFNELRDQLYEFYDEYVQVNLGAEHIEGRPSVLKALIDHATTSGKGGATNVMQGVCVRAGFNCDVDGLPGPGTRAALAELNASLDDGEYAKPEDQLPLRVFAERVRHYLAVADTKARGASVEARAGQLNHLRSWLRRSLRCLHE